MSFNTPRAHINYPAYKSRMMLLTLSFLPVLILICNKIDYYYL